MVRNESTAIEHHFYGHDRQWPKAGKLLLRMQRRDRKRARVSVQRRKGPDAIVIALPPAWVVRVRVSCGTCPAYEGCTGEEPERETNVTPPTVVVPPRESLGVEVLGMLNKWIGKCETIHPHKKPDAIFGDVARGCHPLSGRRGCGCQ